MGPREGRPRRSGNRLGGGRRRDLWGHGHQPEAAPEKKAERGQRKQPTTLLPVSGVSLPGHPSLVWPASPPLNGDRDKEAPGVRVLLRGAGSGTLCPLPTARGLRRGRQTRCVPSTHLFKGAAQPLQRVCFGKPRPRNSLGSASVTFGLDEHWKEGTAVDLSQEKHLFSPFPGQGKFLRWKKHLSIHRAARQGYK